MRDKLKAYDPKLPEQLLKAVKGKRIVLATCYRRKIIGESFENIYSQT